MARGLAGIVTALALACAAGALAAACGTDAVGVDTCRQIENARCSQAPSCANINLGIPVHRNSPVTDVEACQRYYHDACLHGLATNTDPGAVATKACVDAINTGDCNVVYHPETHPACAWLIPPATPVTDAAADADGAIDAADAATE
jgi:hypothetical protein